MPYVHQLVKEGDCVKASHQRWASERERTISKVVVQGYQEMREVEARYVFDSGIVSCLLGYFFS